MLGWRDRLLAAPTMEAAYAAIIREGVSGIPPLFLDQLVHVIMRAALDEACSVAARLCADAQGSGMGRVKSGDRKSVV